MYIYYILYYTYHIYYIYGDTYVSMYVYMFVAMCVSDGKLLNIINRVLPTSNI